MDEVKRKEMYNKYITLATAMIIMAGNEETSYEYCREVIYTVLIESPQNDGAMQVLNVVAFVSLQNKWEYAQSKADFIRAIATFMTAI